MVSDHEAQILNCPIGTVKSTMSQALARLRLLNAVIGEPPHHVSDGTVRRRAARIVKRRVTATAGATALAVAGTVALAVSASATGPGTSAGSGLKAGEPHFYLNQIGDPYGKSGKSATALRSASTGAITGRVRCPGTKSFVISAAAADPRTFFVICGTKRSMWDSSVVVVAALCQKGPGSRRLQGGRGDADGAAR